MRSDLRWLSLSLLVATTSYAQALVGAGVAVFVWRFSRWAGSSKGHAER